MNQCGPISLLCLKRTYQQENLAGNKTIQAFVDGIIAPVIGALAGAVIVITTRSIIDIPTALIAMATAFVLIYIRKVQEPYIILIAAVAGLLIKYSL